MNNSKGFEVLLQHITDVIKESQIKLGYDDNTIQLYYPLASLNHMFGTDYSVEDMNTQLQKFQSYVAPTMGEVHFSENKERYAITISREGVRYVNECVETSPFLVELVEKTGRHGCTMEEILGIFQKYSDEVVSEDMDNGEFDTLIYFKNGKPDDYRYCFHQEGEHIIYHRYKGDDYKDFQF